MTAATGTPEQESPGAEAETSTSDAWQRSAYWARNAAGRPVVWTILSGVAGVLTALWITRHAWGPHVLAGGDITADLVRSQYGIAHLVLHGRPDGWFPRFMLGHEEFLFNGPGVAWMVALLRGLTFGALSTTGAVKVLAIATIALQPLAVAYLARSLGLDRLAAGLAGILSLALSFEFGLGLGSLFVNGLLSHQVGAIPFFLAFGAGLRAYDEPTRRRCIIAGGALALLVITHLISVMILAVMFPIALLFRLGASERNARLRGLRGLLIAGAIAIGLAGFWVLPFVAHRNLHGPVVTWGTDPFDERIASILRGHILYQPFIVKLVIIAWIVVLVRAAFGHLEHLVLLAIPAVYLVIAHVSLKYPGPGDITLQLANRGLGYAGIIALFPVAALVSLGIHKLGEATNEPVLTAGLAVLAILVTVGVSVAHSSEHLAGEIAPATPALRDAATQLRTLVPPGGRFSTTRDYPAEIGVTGVVEPERWLAWASGVDTLNAFNPESSNAGAVAYTADGPSQGQSIDDWVRALRRLGVTDIVVDKPAVDAQLKQSSLVHSVWSEGGVSIYEVLSDSGGRPPVLLDTAGTRATVGFTQRNAEHLRWNVGAEQPFTATIAVAWSPKWHATIDGHGLHVAKTSDGLMQVQMPAGDHTLALTFKPDVWDRLGLVLTLGVLVWLASIPVRRYRRRRNGRRATGTGPVAADAEQPAAGATSEPVRSGSAPT